MKRTIILLTAGVLASCAAPAVEDARDLAFAQRLVARAEHDAAVMASAAVESATSSHVEAEASVDRLPEIAVLPARTRDDEWRGLLAVAPDRLRRLEEAASDDAALGALLAEPLSIDDLAALAVLRSPAVRNARAQYEAARTTFSQSEDLGDLVALFRSFTRDLTMRVGPERSRRATEMIAPYPNVAGISAEVAKRTSDMAFESLRVATRDVVAGAWSAHADAARLAEARRIVREELELDDVLLEVLRSRLESGTGSQSGYLAFESRLERLKTELAILDRRETVVRAQWNQLLSRPESADLVLDIAPESAGPAPQRENEPSLVELALTERQELRVAVRAAERAELGVRLAESMTLPRMDVGSSRYERERAGEAGVQRGAVFPGPGAMLMPRWDFGVREAQVQEMRSRAESMEQARLALRDRVRTDARSALFDVDAASRRVTVHEQDLVPLARNSLDAARGAYEGNRTGYLDLLDAVRRLLDARLGLADARRDLVRSQASLLRAVGVVAPDRR
jgi:outer membrane protein TolC